MTRIAEIAARLRELAAELRDPELADERAAELAGEASALAAEAGTEVDRRLSAAGAAPVDHPADG